MKAKEYYELYKRDILSDEDEKSEKSACDLFMSFLKDSEDTIKLRKAVSDSAVSAVIAEYNDKWNAVVRCFEKEYGFSPLIKDGFLSFWINRIPDLERYIRKPISTGI